MQINVSQLLKESIGTTRDYGVGERIDISDNGDTSLIEGKISLLRTLRGILVKGVLNTGVELNCSRCLSLFHCPVSLNIEEEYIPVVDVESGAPLSPAEDSASFTIDEHHILDLNEAIRQYTLLTIPIKPLCSDDCAGLCPNFGHNLNQGHCDCPMPEPDPRWSKLTKSTQHTDR